MQLSEQPSEQVLEMMHSSEQPVATLPEIIVEIAQEISALTPWGPTAPELPLVLTRSRSNSSEKDITYTSFTVLVKHRFHLPATQTHLQP